MKGLHFVQFAKSAVDPNRIDIKQGHVVDAAGTDNWLLEFNTPRVTFLNIQSVSDLKTFTFFRQAEARDAFVAELMARNTPAIPPEEIPPPPVGAP